MLVTAHAKINLSLDICGKREDGYHLVRMLMQSLSLHDVLTLTREKQKGIRVTTDHPRLETGPENLAYRAAALFLETAGLSDGVRIELQKQIPIGAGLAGGSSDAAAVLQGMAALWGIPFTEEELLQMGMQIGADVPFCLHGGTALAEGIGEQLTTLPALSACWIVLVKPKGEVSTRASYAQFDREIDVTHPNLAAQIDALQKGDLQGVLDCFGNVLQPIAERQKPEIKMFCTALREAGALGAGMSGSGPTVFGVFTDQKLAEQAVRQMQERVDTEAVFLTEPERCGGKDGGR